MKKLSTGLDYQDAKVDWIEVPSESFRVSDTC